LEKALKKRPVFFEKLPATTQFRDFAKRAVYVDAPTDWFVVITDVIGSTKAIENGRYKDVNAVGVASIVCIQNAVKGMAIPYVFGGDGAIALIPGELEEDVRRALSGMKQLAKSAFDLSLRAGLVPMSELKEAGCEILVGRYAMSEHVSQAFLAGDGVAKAEEWVKDTNKGRRYDVGEGGQPRDVDCSGFECRWQPIRSTNGTIVSVIVEAKGETIASRNDSYAAVIEEIKKILGPLDGVSPVHRNALNLSRNPQDYRQEICIRTKMVAAWRRWVYGAYTWFETMVGRMCLALGITIAGFGERYVEEVVAHSDFRKFDNVLRMVIDVDSRQREEIVSSLEAFHQKGKINYGVHVSSSALMTCAVSNRHGQHIHFVDGADGGYALAARQLKAQKKNL